MIVEIRMYKQYDLDLLSLFDAGYPVATLFLEVVNNFANGRPVRFVIDETINCSLKDKHTVRSRIIVKDKNAVKMLKSIKRRYRNAFCKMLLRNSLLQQNMDCFFAKSDFFTITALNLKNLKTEDYIEIALSTLKKKRKIVLPVRKEQKQEILQEKANEQTPLEKTVNTNNLPKFLKEEVIDDGNDNISETNNDSSGEDDDDLFEMFSKL